MTMANPASESSGASRFSWVASLFGTRRQHEASAPRTAEPQKQEPRDRTALLERILDTTEEGILLVNAASDVLLANEAARTILGLSERDTSPALEAIGLSLLVARAIRAGGPISTEREIHLPSRRSIALRAMPFDEGAVVLVTDVTVARRLENVRKDFAANVSHELKTPVSSIGLLAEQLVHAVEEDPATAARFAAHLVDETERLGRLMRDLLDLSRIESDLPLVAREVDATGLAAEVIQRVRTMAVEKGIKISLEGGPTMLRADASHVATALMNLLDNAVRYSPEGAEVKIVISRRAGNVFFVVSDNGPGIPSNEIGRIFERFYRVDKARARATGGSGLGLSIVKHVAERHGGSVEAASELGRGTTFTLKLPVQPEDVP
jgi:signal transduction histidine kinase